MTHSFPTRRASDLRNGWRKCSTVVIAARPESLLPPTASISWGRNIRQNSRSRNRRDPGFPSEGHFARVVSLDHRAALFRTRIKFCGLRRPGDLATAVALGVDALALEIGRAPGRDRVCPSVVISVDAQTLNKKKN